MIKTWQRLIVAALLLELGLAPYCLLGPAYWALTGSPHVIVSLLAILWLVVFVTAAAVSILTTAKKYIL